MILTISRYLGLQGDGGGPQSSRTPENEPGRETSLLAFPSHGPLVDGFILGMVDDDSVLGGFSSQNINISSH